MFAVQNKFCMIDNILLWKTLWLMIASTEQKSNNQSYCHYISAAVKLESTFLVAESPGQMDLLAALFYYFANAVTKCMACCFFIFVFHLNHYGIEIYWHCVLAHRKQVWHMQNKIIAPVSLDFVVHKCMAQNGHSVTNKGQMCKWCQQCRMLPFQEFAIKCCA